jgi:hypothetical protein
MINPKMINPGNKYFFIAASFYHAEGASLTTSPLPHGQLLSSALELTE